MPKEFNRSDRVADAMQRSLANAIRMEIQDPRVGMVNINAVEVSRDLALAKVFVTFIGVDDERAIETSVSILNKAAGFLRNVVSKDLTIRSTPRIHFYYDKTAVRGQVLSSLIDRAIAEDKSHHQDDAGQEEE
ncbi:30S ribosome-binding factor RbfA [Teredinibacter turnerae]|uniref:Ribosome-binding factor A n=1 Tax=Teredinibacter turnerae (strain ATCC 39867 / T7901) TaxID=377629 RepID=RBFA_TERTT|nr:30S ribosome-binding factor RbfA [Teredinibacter turnerae]C5BPV8.1 RecName: Full=Ribosome-binding factor A [Teredinibacter turnerae T7901]ACR12916.1 ribosome-binding factor A [Teredinibacter turnerae T7901]